MNDMELLIVIISIALTILIGYILIELDRWWYWNKGDGKKYRDKFLSDYLNWVKEHGK